MNLRSQEIMQGENFPDAVLFVDGHVRRSKFFTEKSRSSGQLPDLDFSKPVSLLWENSSSAFLFF